MAVMISTLPSMPDLEHMDRHVFENRARLIRYPFRVERHYIFHPGGILYGNGRNHR